MKSSIFSEAAELLTEARGGRSDAQRRAIFAKMENSVSSRYHVHKRENTGVDLSVKNQSKRWTPHMTSDYHVPKGMEKQMVTRGSQLRKTVASVLRSSRAMKKPKHDFLTYDGKGKSIRQQTRSVEKRMGNILISGATSRWKDLRTGTVRSSRFGLRIRKLDSRSKV